MHPVLDGEQRDGLRPSLGDLLQQSPSQSPTFGLDAFDGRGQLLVVAGQDDPVSLPDRDPAGRFEGLGGLVDEEGGEMVVGQYPVSRSHQGAGHDTCLVEEGGIDLDL